MRKKIINATGQTDHEIKYQEVAGLKWHLNGRVVFKRVRRFFTKEPKTLEWIDSFGTQDKFLDIGANIGIYSLYAAKKDLQVYAFEPQALNFAELYTNIYLNDLQHKITGYGIALTDVNSIEYLSLLSMVPGQSHNNYDISKHNQIKQGCAGYRLDHLVEQGVIPQPDHVKIDVDGIEHLILKGAENLLKNKNLKEISIEMNPSYYEQYEFINKLMEENNFKLTSSLNARLLNDINHKLEPNETVNVVFKSVCK
jgi:FkbM family methyltransferase